MDYKSDLSKSYHWTELRGGTDAPLYPEILLPTGIKLGVVCRLKGESTKGPTATEAKLREGIFDVEYGYSKLDSLLKYLETEDKVKLLEGYIDHIKQEEADNS